MEDTLTDTPHSLLEAAKITAKAIDLEWSIVHRYYRDLQGDPKQDEGPWLPKSLGRNVWAAHPHYIARLLIALGSAATPTEAAQSVTTINRMTPGGRKRHLAETDVYFVEKAISDLLLDPEKLLTLDHIEFDPTYRSVKIVFQDGSFESFVEAGTSPNWQRGLYWVGVIRASVLKDIAAEVRWRTFAESPINKAVDGNVDPEA